MSSYQKYPSTYVKTHDGELLAGYDAIISRIRQEYEAFESSGKKDYLIAIDTYPGVCDDEVLEALKGLSCSRLFNMRTVFRGEEELAEHLKYHLTDDRVFGRMFFGELEDLMDPGRLAKMREDVKTAEGLSIVYGFGAFLAAPPAQGQAVLPTGAVVDKAGGETEDSTGSPASAGDDFRHPDLCLYLDMARWEIQLRYRKGMPNYNCTNFDEDILRKFKRGYFIEWRVADKHKMHWFDQVD